MSNRGDDEALTWDGDDDPTLATRRDVATPTPATPVQSTSVPVEERVAQRPRETRPPKEPQSGLGNVALVAIGMLAAAYLLFAAGWLIAGLRLQGLEALPVPQPTLVALTLIAATAPIAWFVAVLVLTRAARVWVRFAWLAAGVVLLVPWPFVGTGGVL